MSLAASGLGLLLRLSSTLRGCGVLRGEINGWLATGHVDQICNRYVVPFREAEQLFQCRVPGAFFEFPEVSILASALGCRLQRQALPMPSNLEIAGNELGKAGEIHASWVVDRASSDDYPVVYLFKLTPRRDAGFHARLRTMGVELPEANTRARHSVRPPWASARIEA